MSTYLKGIRICIGTELYPKRDPLDEEAFYREIDRWETECIALPNADEVDDAINGFGVVFLIEDMELDNLKSLPGKIRKFAKMVSKIVSDGERINK